MVVVTLKSSFGIFMTTVAVVLFLVAMARVKRLVTKIVSKMTYIVLFELLLLLLLLEWLSNVVARRRTQFVIGWVSVCRQVYRLDM